MGKMTEEQTIRGVKSFRHEIGVLVATMKRFACKAHEGGFFLTSTDVHAAARLLREASDKLEDHLEPPLAGQQAPILPRP